tara:strand:+ start:126 stop:713 length:588 start_codon:yes stop_codon:yes gene_type:complete
MYNLNFTGSMPPTVYGGSITFFENLNSLVDISNTKYIIALCRSRKTNITRCVTTFPTGGSNDIDNPVYVSNNRFWKFRITFLFAKKTLLATFDNTINRKLSLVAMPTEDTMDIDLYYGDVNTYQFSQLTKIEGTNIVVNLTAKEDYVQLGDLPISYFTEYKDNDVVPIIPSTDTGQPASDQEQLNAQYGTQIYQV